MAGEKLSLPQGTLDLLILRTLALEPLHGWAISERVQQISSDALQIPQGSLYPALHRLERRGSVKARWGTSNDNRRAKLLRPDAAWPPAAAGGPDRLAQDDRRRCYRPAARLADDAQRSAHLPSARATCSAVPSMPNSTETARPSRGGDAGDSSGARLAQQEASRRARMALGDLEQIRDECSGARAWRRSRPLPTTFVDMRRGCWSGFVR